MGSNEFGKEMEPFEKEEILHEALDNVIVRFIKEYNITYSQAIGILEILQSELIHEGFMSDEDENE